MIDTGLSDKVILVTGANNPYGIGAAVGLAFARQKAKVFLHYFRWIKERASSVHVNSPGEDFYYQQQAKGAEEIVRTIQELGGQAHAREADLSDGTCVQPLFEEVEKAFGPVSVLVNNAAHWEGDTFLPKDAELANKLHESWTERPQPISTRSFDRIFNVNTRAPVLLMSEFARRQIERGAGWGRIVNVSTDGAYCFPSETSYGASKFALESFTRSAAVEFGPLGTTVNCVSLGPVQTGWITRELERQVVPTIPLGRVGAPEEVADVIVFLASEQARWVTGQTLYVGGGHKV
jgi:3-oxoacyl-[acyl-carrier protein] reductase